jgi:hypothetical protein
MKQLRCTTTFKLRLQQLLQICNSGLLILRERGSLLWLTCQWRNLVLHSVCHIRPTAGARVCSKHNTACTMTVFNSSRGLGSRLGATAC